MELVRGGTESAPLGMFSSTFSEAPLELDRVGVINVKGSFGGIGGGIS
jgi:hypothetical protein